MVDEVRHPAVIFLIRLGVTTKVRSPPDSFGIRSLFASMATNFTNFCVVGVIWAPGHAGRTEPSLGGIPDAVGAPAAQQDTEPAC